jgi:hypothetical protein
MIIVSEQESIVFDLFYYQEKALYLFYFITKYDVLKPGPASAVEKLQTTEREDQGSTPDEGL